MLHAQRGWSVSTISSAITFHFVFSAILVAYLPDAYRRFGYTLPNDRPGQPSFFGE